jgi:hypothetical protein
MNNTQINLVKLLSCAIFEKKADTKQLEGVNFNELIESAHSHQVKALIYSVLHNDSSLVNANKAVFEQLKKETVLTAIGQMHHIRQVSAVLEEFKQRGIPIIVLKGLVIRGLYPRPELRTMCDADILVRKSDLTAVKELMEKLGYAEGESSPVHISYEKNGARHIEVHWTIADNRFFREQGVLEDKMWDSAVKVKVGNSEALSFSDEDLALHLCIHMAVHILTHGFGIRQILDLALLISKRGDSINWTSFCKKAKQWKIEKFAAVIFLGCKYLFQITIPEEIEKDTDSIDNKLVDQLLTDVLDGGVYGKRDLSTIFANEFAYGSDDEDQGGGLWGILRRFLRLLFPPITTLSDKYNYAKKVKLLIPLAWMHHLFFGITNKEYGTKEKLCFVRTAIFNSAKRQKLLKKLEL